LYHVIDLIALYIYRLLAALGHFLYFVAGLQLTFLPRRAARDDAYDDNFICVFFKLRSDTEEAAAHHFIKILFLYRREILRMRIFGFCDGIYISPETVIRLPLIEALKVTSVVFLEIVTCLSLKLNISFDLHIRYSILFLVLVIFQFYILHQHTIFQVIAPAVGQLAFARSISHFIGAKLQIFIIIEGKRLAENGNIELCTCLYTP